VATSSKITPNAFNISGQFDEVTGGVVTNGLVTYLDAGSVTSYPGAGNIIKDLSGNGCDAMVMGGVTYVANGAASYFNWSSTENDGNYLVGYMGKTLGATVQDLTIVFYPNSVGQNYNFATLVSNALASTQNDRALRVQPLTAGTWLVANPGNSNDWARTATNYYVNGALAGTAFQTINNSNDIAINTNQWQTLGGARTNTSAAFDYNGYYYIGEGGYPQRGWSGGIAAVLFYNRVLTAQEQLENYNYFAARYGLVPQRPAPVYKTISSGNINIGGQFDEITYNVVGVKKNLVNSSVFMANAKVGDNTYWGLGYGGFYANPNTTAPDGTNTAASFTMINTSLNYPVVTTGTSSTNGNTIILTPGQWYTFSTYFKRPNVIPYLPTTGRNNYFALVTNSTNAFTNFQLTRNQIEYPATTGQGVVHTITPLISTNTNGGSLRFNGSANLTSTGTNLMAFGTGNFTIEYYLWQYTFIYGCTILDSRTSTSSSTGFSDQWYGSTYYIQIGGSNVYTATTPLNINSAWIHIAVVRSGTGTNQTQVYINGVLDGSFTLPNNFTDPDLKIGGAVNGGSNLNTANLTNLRITKGVALYTGNFTPPLSPPVAGANTALLLNVIQPGAFTLDSSANNYTLTNVGVTYSGYAPNFNGWYRVSMPYRSSVVYEQLAIWGNGYGGPNMDGNVTILWGTQLEAGNVATIYQPTINSNISPPMAQRIENTGNVYISGAYDEVSQPLSPVTDSSLIMHLDPALLQSYPGTGNVWYDLSGNKNNATFGTGAYNAQTPKTPIYSADYGGYVSFTGSYGNGNKMWANTAVASRTFTILSERTMSIWVRFHNTVRSQAFFNPVYANKNDIPTWMLNNIGGSYSPSLYSTNPATGAQTWEVYGAQAVGTYPSLGSYGSGGIIFGINNYGDYGLAYNTNYNYYTANTLAFNIELESRENTPSYYENSVSYTYNNPGAQIYNQWINIVGTHSPLNNAITLYVNGSVVASGTFAAAAFAPGETYPYGFPYLMIGYNSIAGGNAQTQTLDADVGQVLLYTRALSAAEVAQNFTTYRGRYGV
jgi:hypothetical protein